MPMFDLMIVVTGSLISAVIAIWWLNRITPAAEISAEAEAEGQVLLFEEGALHHATPDAQDRFSLEPGAHEWEDLRDKILKQVPDFPLRPGVAAFGETRVLIDGGPTHSDVLLEHLACHRSLVSVNNQFSVLEEVETRPRHSGHLVMEQRGRRSALCRSVIALRQQLLELLVFVPQ